MEIDERMSRILAITDFYLSRFGRTQIGIFQLPTSDPNPSWFYIFINTLMSALRRNNYMPYNFWIRDIPGERFILILWVNGYFRTNLQEITPFVKRAWGVHSPGPDLRTQGERQKEQQKYGTLVHKTPPTSEQLLR